MHYNNFCFVYTMYYTLLKLSSKFGRMLLLFPEPQFTASLLIISSYIWTFSLLLKNNFHAVNNIWIATFLRKSSLTSIRNWEPSTPVKRIQADLLPDASKARADDTQKTLEAFPSNHDLTLLF